MSAVFCLELTEQHQGLMHVATLALEMKAQTHPSTNYCEPLVNPLWGPRLRLYLYARLPRGN